MSRKQTKQEPVKQATAAIRDVRGFVPSASGGRVRQIPAE